MKRILATLAILAMIFCVGCSNERSHEAVMGDTATVMEEMGGLLDQIKTVDDVEKHKVTLRRLRRRMDVLRKEAEELGEPAPEVKAALAKGLDERIINARLLLDSAFDRILADEKLQQAIKKIGISDVVDEGAEDDAAKDEGASASSDK
jgi:hypothetical protein